MSKEIIMTAVLTAVVVLAGQIGLKKAGLL
jgi:hypothetical protein